MVGLIITALHLLTYLIIADEILSWVIPSRERFPRKLTARITEPLYAPVHRVLDPRKTGGIDLAPIVLIFAIQAVISILIRLSLP
jgi:uncharacterized protein YggT (Ycf19 family)